MSNQLHQPHKSTIVGLNANIMALLAYIASVIIAWIPVVRYLAWLVPLALFFIERQSSFVRFHALQSFLLHAVSAALGFLVSVVLGGIVGASMRSAYTAYAAVGAAGIIGLLAMVISLIITVFAIIAMVKAYGYKEYHIPLIGGIAAKYSGQR